MENSGRGRHFVLVHGLCHGAWCWYKVATLLRSAGHTVSAIDLAASGVNPKRLDEVHSISDYFQPLMEFMEDLPPEPEGRVVLVGHSMGGVAISLAMERFPRKISLAVFATAFMPGPDFTFSEIAQETNQGFDFFMDTQYTFDQGPDKPPTSVLFGPKFLSSKLYQLSPPEELVLATLVVTPSPLFNDEKSLEETTLTKKNYGSVHRVFIVCDQDMAIKQDLQKWMIENNPPDEVKVISGADHMVMFSKPQQLCSYLQAIAVNRS